MVEPKIREFINKNGIRAYMERPAAPPEKYVVIDKTGSVSSNGITNHTLAIQSIAGRLSEAAKLNEEVKKLLLQNEIPGISGISLSNDYNYTNLAAKEYRYQAVYIVSSLELED